MEIIFFLAKYVLIFKSAKIDLDIQWLKLMIKISSEFIHDYPDTYFTKMMYYANN